MDQLYSRKCKDFKRGSLTWSFTEENIKVCGEHIRRGELVAFPTETVYGLGANALSVSAIVKIFKAKERPMNDPVIVHVTSFSSCKELIDADFLSKCPEIFGFLKRLADKFWPGPLTIVVPCSSLIPSEVTAGTGCVGLRYPRNAIAQRLIEESGVPIAAPSANKFGHISPTQYTHVEEDLGNTDFPIIIVKKKKEEKKMKICEVGIESTVCKIEEAKPEENVKVFIFKILRKGGTSTLKLKEFLDTVNKEHKAVKFRLEIVKKFGKPKRKKKKKKIDPLNTEKSVKDNTASPKSPGSPSTLLFSPGQLITHYAPRLPSYLYLPPDDFFTVHCSNDMGKCTSLPLSQCVLIDFHGRYKKELKLQREEEEERDVKKYLDFSKEGNMEIFAARLFAVLRQAEQEQKNGAKAIILPHMENMQKKKKGSGGKTEWEHSDAIFDRLFRAASGQFCTVKDSKVYFLKSEKEKRFH